MKTREKRTSLFVLVMAVCLSAANVVEAKSIPIPGKIISVYDTFHEQGRSANLLYFNTLAMKPWQNDKQEYRLPVLITESIGMKRKNAPVSIFYELPAGILPSSIRVVTTYGEEIPSQVRIIDKNKNSVEILFLISMIKYEQVPVFIYYSSAKIKKADYSAPLAFNVREGRDFYHLENGKLKVELDKKSPLVTALIPVAGIGKNQLGEFYPFNKSKGNIGSSEGKVEITEDGPIRKTISYVNPGNPRERTEYSLYPFSSMVNYRILSASPKAVRSFIRWKPYGDTKEDRLYYETEKGLKRSKICYLAAGDLKQYILPDLKEGWLALEDKRGEVGGEIFELKDTSGVTLYQHSSGYRLRRRSRRIKEHKGGLIAARDDFKLIRKIYLSWKNPPLISLGEPQARMKIKPQVPVWGKDFIRMHHGAYHVWYGFYRINEHTAGELVKENLRLGANYFAFGIRRPVWKIKQEELGKDGRKVEKEYQDDPFILSELIPTAHKHGLGINVNLLAGRSCGCPIAGRALYVQMARGAAKTGADMLSLIDEYGFTPKSDKAGEKFLKDYNMKLPADDYRDQPGKIQRASISKPLSLPH